MSKQTINIGASPNDGTGTPLRTSFDYTNQNFTELYTALGGGVGLPGATTQVIFNDGGTNLAGDAGLVYNKTTDALTVAGLVTAGSATVTGAATVGTTLGVTGVSTFAAGTAALPALTTTGDTNTGIYYPAADTFAVSTGGVERYRVDSTGLGIGASPIAKLHIKVTGGTDDTLLSFGANQDNFYTAGSSGVHIFRNLGTERLRIDASGNLGIGVTPSAWTAYKAIQINTLSSLSASTGSTDLALNWRFDSSNKYIANGFASSYTQYNGTHVFNIAANNTLGAGAALTFTQAMTLDASGNLLVGVTSAPSGTIGGSGFIANNNARKQLYLATTSAGSQILALFLNPNGTVGTIETNGSLTAYNVSSDYRLKHEVKPLTGALNRITALKPSTYKWKVDGSAGEGFIAHELAEVVPFAVSGEKDAVNEDGTVKAQGVDLSKVVPILVAAIQELTARVQTLEAK